MEKNSVVASKSDIIKVGIVGPVPTKGSPLAAGYDLSAKSTVTIEPYKRAKISTGITVAIPPGYYGRVAPRSGLAVKHGIDVLAGVIDPDYRGEIGVILVNLGDEPFVVTPGMRVAQLIFEKFAQLVDFVDVTNIGGNLDDTSRGTGGFGSSGV